MPPNRRHQNAVELSSHTRRAGLLNGACAWLACLFALCLLASTASVPSVDAQGSFHWPEGMSHADFPFQQGQEVEVENTRGGVRVYVDDEDEYKVDLLVFDSAEAKAAAARGAKPTKGRVAARQKARAAEYKMPVTIDQTGGSIKISVNRSASASPARVELMVGLPSTARLKVRTTVGALEVFGAPASLNAQTISGDIKLAFFPPPDADVTAQSLNGSVSIGEGLDESGARVLKGKVQARLGAASARVNLFSGRGLISLRQLTREEVEAYTESIGTSLAGGPPPDASAVRPRVKETPDNAPFKPTQPKPAPSETPQEVEEDDVVRVESDLVTVNVSVVDRASGRGLTGLSASDFNIYEDSVEQHVEHFESAEGPFDLLLLLDLSGSTARVTDTIRAAARRFVDSTRARDRVAIVAFAGDTQLVSPLTADRDQLHTAIERISRPEGDTRLYDAVGYALDYMTRSQDPARRRAVIILSDGLDSTLPNVTGRGSTLAYEELRSRAQEFDGILYSVWTNTEFYEAFSPQDIQPETYDLAHDRMKELSDAGGGAFYEVERLEDLAGAYERVVADLGTVYSLSYRPTNKKRDGRWRTIRVRLPRLQTAVARGRRGYFAN